MKFAHVAALAAFVLLLVVLPSLCEPEKVDVRETMHEKLIELLDAHDVVVITKATCPYCKYVPLSSLEVFASGTDAKTIETKLLTLHCVRFWPWFSLSH